MRIVADQSRCAGAGQCVLTDPALFDQSEDDGAVLLLETEPTARHHAAVRLAAGICPGRAISVDDA